MKRDEERGGGENGRGVGGKGEQRGGEGRGGKSRDKMTRFFLKGPIGRASVVLGPTWSLWPPYRWSVFRAILHGSQYIQGREIESVSLSSHANLFCILRTHQKKDS